MTIRKATAADIPAVVGIYGDIHTAVEAGKLTVDWRRGVYPVPATAEEALERGDLFVMEAEGEIVASAAINHEQMAEYAFAAWTGAAEGEAVMVLHTLAVSPKWGGRGFGKAFVRFYEDYAREQGCRVLRLDAQEVNAAARRLYTGLGYRETGVVTCAYPGFGAMRLMCLEKLL